MPLCEDVSVCPSGPLIFGGFGVLWSTNGASIGSCCYSLETGKPQLSAYQANNCLGGGRHCEIVFNDFQHLTVTDELTMRRIGFNVQPKFLKREFVRTMILNNILSLRRDSFPFEGGLIGARDGR